MRVLKISLFICLFMVIAPAASPNSPGRTVHSDRTIQTLRQTLQADPSDIRVQQQLAQLIRHQQDQKRWATNALAVGLELYIEVGPGAARPWLIEARSCDDVVQLADRFSPVALDDIIDQGEQHQDEQYCPACSGTGWQDCLVCGGSGVRPCYICKGKGFQTDPDNPNAKHICTRCRGWGTIDCVSCRGYGIVKCRKCAGHRFIKVDSAQQLDDETVKDLRQLIDRARYLSQGGIDYFTSQAMATFSSQQQRFGNGLQNGFEKREAP